MPALDEAGFIVGVLAGEARGQRQGPRRPAVDNPSKHSAGYGAEASYGAARPASFGEFEAIAAPPLASLPG